MRVSDFGNSGSGQSVHARRLAAERGPAHLDLDTIVPAPGTVGAARSTGDVDADPRVHPAA
jgi:adenylate kinase family enzyme